MVFSFSPKKNLFSAAPSVYYPLPRTFIVHGVALLVALVTKNPPFSQLIIFCRFFGVAAQELHDRDAQLKDSVDRLRGIVRTVNGIIEALEDKA